MKYTVSDVKKSTQRQIRKGIQKTRELKFYLFKFTFRVAIFLGVLFLYLKDRNLMESFMTQPFWRGFTLIHLIWFVFMGLMILHLIPNNRLSMAWKKAKEAEYRPVELYNELELMHYIQKQNIAAWKVMLVWLVFNAVWGALYLFGILTASDLLMLTVFYFLCDYICILFFCPFQKIVMKNKCCINCRIYDWGHFMMFTPMLFIKNFYCWSLFFTSIVVLIHWEMLYARYPERFWHGSNQTLQCKNCKDKTCQWKKIGKVARSKKE